MKRKPQPTFNELCDAIQQGPAPTSQATWRRLSTAMRQARRSPGARGRTILIDCGCPRRRIYLEATWGGMGCYNGPSPLRMVLMIAHQRTMHQRGSRTGRVADAQGFARAARRDGPVPLP